MELDSKHRNHPIRPRNRGLTARLGSLVLATTVVGLAVTPPATADITFDLEYQDGRSDPPNWDLEGDHLIRIVTDATEHWASMFPGVTGEVKIHYRWESWPRRGLFEPAIGVIADDERHCLELAETTRPLGAVNRFTIRFYTTGGDCRWYADTDPEDSSEYDMRSIPYWRSVIEDAETGFWTGNVHDFFEVGIEGRARETAAGLSEIKLRNARLGMDLYTVALREVGKTLGLGFRTGAAEVLGHAYKLDPPLPGSSSVDEPIIASMYFEDGDWFEEYLKAPHALMRPDSDYEVGFRRLPSALDIAIVAAINGWTEVDLPRKHFTGASGNTWASADSWYDESPRSDQSGVLDCTEVAPIVSGMFVFSNDMFVGPYMTYQFGDGILSLDGLLSIGTGSELLTIGGDVFARRILLEGNRMWMTGGGSLVVTDAVEALAGSQLLLYGDYDDHAILGMPMGELRAEDASILVRDLDAEVGRLVLDGTSSEFRGFATVVFGLEHLSNDGLIVFEGELGGTLVFRPILPKVKFDYDGDLPSEQGRIEAIDGSILFGAGASDSFEGSMRIGGTRIISIDGGFSINTGGELALLGDEARFQADSLVVTDGRVYVAPVDDAHTFLYTVDEAGEFGNQVWGPSGGHSHVSDEANLHLVGELFFLGGVVARGEGKLFQVGDLTVMRHPLGCTSVDPLDCTSEVRVKHYVWDGQDPAFPGNTSDTTIKANARLEIYSSVSNSSDGHDGIITIEQDAELYVARDWVLDGELVLEGGTLVSGGELTNRGTIRGYGTIRTMVRNENSIECDWPGAIVFEPPLINVGSGEHNCD